MQYPTGTVLMRVSMRTYQLLNAVNSSGGTIQVFNPAIGVFSAWRTPKRYLK